VQSRLIGEESGCCRRRAPPKAPRFSRDHAAL